jgi:hypothetical protein
MAARVLTTALFWIPAVVTVSAPSAPIFVEEPTDTVAISAGLSRSATLSCKAISYDSVAVIEWYKDDVEIETASIPTYNASSTSLVVGTTNASDSGVILEGTYYCVIGNAYGTIRSRSALIKSQEVVSFIQSTRSVFNSMETLVFAQLVYAEEPLIRWSIGCNGRTFQCPSANCSLWHHVSVVGRLLLFSLLRLTYNDIKAAISNCEIIDPVTIYDSFGQVNVVKFAGQVFYPNSTLQRTQNISVAVGGTATLYCISNHPNSTYAWERDGSPIQVANLSRYSLIIDGVLQIHNITKTDGGVYTCSATAIYPDFGQQTRYTMVNLTVYSLPSASLSLVLDGKASTDCNSATVCRIHPSVSSVIILCQFTGSLPLLVQILHNTVSFFEETVTDNQRSVQIRMTNNVSPGAYQCIVNNPYGSTQTSLNIIVQGVSTPTSETLAASSYSSMPSLSSERKMPPVHVEMNDDSDSTVWKVLAVLGWSLLLCFNVIVIILFVWLRRQVAFRRKMSYSVRKREDFRDSCNDRTQGNDALVYANVGTVIRDTECHDQYESPITATTSL